MRVIKRLRGKDHFPVRKGTSISYDEPRGYYIDLTRKAVVEPADDAALDAMPLHVMTCQWGLGCYDRYLAGDGERWRDAAIRVGRYLVRAQEREGALTGAWRHTHPFPHTFDLPAGWISAMAQGEGASLLVRLFRETGEEEFADTAIRAVAFMERKVEDGGVCRELGGGPLPEEYPTEPASHVLNGAIFAAWGYHDVARGLGHANSAERFEAVTDTLADNLELWDVGFGSRYDLYPHPMVNVAAPWYHRLHIDQLDILAGMTARPEFGAMADRWRGYARSRWKSTRALIHKAVFRVVVPK